MAKTTAAPQAQTQQAAPGSLLSLPGNPIQPRLVEEVGPCSPGAITALSQGTQVQVQFSKFQTSDVARGYLLEIDASSQVDSTGASATVTQSPLFPWTILQQAQVQFESAYSTYRLNGPLAFAMQSYRPLFAPTSVNGTDFAGGAGGVPTNAAGSEIYSPYSTAPTATPNLALDTSNAAQAYKLFLEIPVAQFFDQYFDLDTAGNVQGVYHGVHVSPQYMAATTRTVIPAVTYNPVLATNNLAGGLASIPTGGTSTGAASVAHSWYRDGWLPPAGNMPAYSPPTFGWQYSRDYIAVQPSQAQQFAVPLDNSVPGQGQLLSLVFYTWDPALNSGAGGLTPLSAYQTVELIQGSGIQLRQQTPQVNLIEWGSQHGGRFLPGDFMGWDLAKERSGKLSNSKALNSLVMANTQIRVTYASGSVPSAAATLFVGVERLVKVGS